MPQRLPPVLSSLDLPLPELLAARLDGELFRVDDCFTPVDEIEQPRHRARAAHAGLSGRLIAEQLSAAWIWGALELPPRPHQFCVALGARIHHPTGRGMTLREVVIEPTEVAVLDGHQVTTPLRTIVDLARFSPVFAELEHSVVTRLMALGGFGLQHCLEDIDRRRNLPNKRQAIERLTTLSATGAL